MRDSKGLFSYEEYSTMIDNFADFHFTPIKVGLEYVSVYLMIETHVTCLLINCLIYMHAP